MYIPAEMPFTNRGLLGRASDHPVQTDDHQSKRNLQSGMLLVLDQLKYPVAFQASDMAQV